MSDLIDRQAAKLAIIEKGQASKRYKIGEFWELNRNEIWDALDGVPSAQPEVIRCKDCKYQKKVFHEDKRRKDGGYYIFGCELVDGYSPVCFDDEFCSRAERRTDG